MAEEMHTVHSSDSDTGPEHGLNMHKRQSRVTVKYNRKQLQKRLDVEKWIDEGLERLFEGQDMPEEVNIDDLLVLSSDEERTHKLQVFLQTCTRNTEAFIAELLQKLHGLHKQEELQNEGIEHPCLHTYPHHHGNIHHHRGNHQHPTHQTL
ncbi:protein phosphatase 1, regulatory (inhibitor) subunit 14Aa isoform X2 [Pimephales promelas]|uniref:protein phosphatase 1, regulatory (inhibitor) subunit 14Aa isoform X2 n=1 Tax=Pimephales promelas TaxID=90988 RepID=UPI001955E385|nr:protein phosphatase 1, regulatory (inhibitor) subunit 14Aa isoform X2 [Pimephales promelas]KAG1937493.1 protein phosphatase 1 regulatory subunit 14B [Pimephales promelas]